MNENIAAASALADRLCRNIALAIVGKNDVIKKVVAAVLADGHVLMEDVPGTGKTMLSKALALSIGGRFSRIQFTPDLLPLDVVGGSVLDRRTGEFAFKRGPVFANVLLADEINRATPRTQSGLLEAMEERQITSDGVTYPLDPPFFVLATQNPVETQGTFPLPEAQLDRFLVRLTLGYTDSAQAREMVERHLTGQCMGELAPVCTPGELRLAQEACREVYIHQELIGYAVALAEATRDVSIAALGASPRAILALCRAAQGYALLEGREFVTPEDIQAMLEPAFGHRIMLKNAYTGVAERMREFLGKVMASVAVPSEIPYYGQDK